LRYLSRDTPPSKALEAAPGSAVGDEFVQFDWLRQRVNKVAPGCRSTWNTEPNFQVEGPRTWKLRVRT